MSLETKNDVKTTKKLAALTSQIFFKALQKMRNNKAPGLTGISVDDMKEWYEDAFPEEGEGTKESLKRWKLVTEIIRICWTSGDIPEAFFYGVLVIIPKDDKGGVRGIGLLETIHKLISQIINMRMAKAIDFFKVGLK